MSQNFYESNLYTSLVEKHDTGIRDKKEIRMTFKKEIYILNDEFILS